MKAEIQLIRLSIADVDLATDILTEAFLNQSPITNLFREPHRKRQTAYFMKCTCVYAMLYGECYTNAEKQGVALWLSPGKTALTPAGMYKSGMLAAPFKIGLSGFLRFMSFAGFTDKAHKNSAPMLHYYLCLMGVKPSAQGKGVGSFLLKSMLERIDEEKMPTYLETQNESNVRLYEKFGFEIAEQGEIPKLKEITSWGMFRKEAV